MGKLFKSSVISSIVLFMFGTLLFFQADFTLISISYVLGGVLVALGVLALLDYSKKKSEKKELNIIYGIVTVIMGILIITNPKTIGSIVPFVLGLLIIINGGIKLQYSFDAQKKGKKIGITAMTLSIVMVIIGILLIINPFKGAEIITKIIGALIIFYSLMDIITTIILKTSIKEARIIADASISEAEVVEETVEK